MSDTDIIEWGLMECYLKVSWLLPHLIAMVYKGGDGSRKISAVQLFL